MENNHSSTIHPFDDPVILELDAILSKSLFNESGRGALLIATSHVEDFLASLIKAVMPIEVSAKDKDRLFAYPGPLCSFSSKIELAYAFRLIDKSLYDNLNALRKIRNDAAHKPAEFALEELSQKMIAVYSLGPGFYTLINGTSTEFVVKQRIERVEKYLKEQGYSEKETGEKIVSLFSEPEKIKAIEKEIPFWELRLGICLMCFLLLHQKEKLTNITRCIRTWADLNKD